MLAKYHVLQGHDVTVIASLFTYNQYGREAYLPSPSSYVDPDGYKVIRLDYKRPLAWGRRFRHYQGLYSAIEDASPDIIFSHNVSFGDTGKVVRYLKSHPGTKLFADNHADFINSAKNFLSKYFLHPIVWRHYSKKLEPYLQKCYGVLPIRCRFLKEMYHMNPGIVQYLPLGVDDDLIPQNRENTRNRIRRELNIPESAFLIFTGGKIDRLKNTNILFDAINLIENRNIFLVICGVLTPEMEYLRDGLTNNGNCRYLGWCDSRRVMECMVASDIACFPGTHSTLWEQSVGLGLPAIFKHWDEIDHVDVNGNCMFVKGDDAEELRSRIEDLLDKRIYERTKQCAVKASKEFIYSEIAKRAIDD